MLRFDQIWYNILFVSDEILFYTFFVSNGVFFDTFVLVTFALDGFEYRKIFIISREIFGIWRRTLKKTIKYKNKNQQPLAAEIGRSHAIFSWAFCHAISIWDSADYICQIWSIRNKFDIHNYVAYENLLNVILSRKVRVCHWMCLCSNVKQKWNFTLSKTKWNFAEM